MIYTINALHQWRDDDGADLDRTFGYYRDLDEARRAVENNACDINEAGWYPCVVIESVGEGIHPIIEKLHFYKWEDMKYNECEPFEGTENFMTYGNIG